jgi:alpha-tubulin suppressor-like RCC1 family protein
VVVLGLTAATAATAGFDYSCAQIDNGKTLQCWGRNYYGQLGNGTTTGSRIPVTVLP